MNAALKNSFKADVTDSSMRKAFILSVIFHVLIFAVAAFGIPLSKKEPPEISQPIAVDFVTIDELTQTDVQVQPTPKPEPEKEIQKPKAPEPKPAEAVKNTAQNPPDLTKPKQLEQPKEAEPEKPKPAPAPTPKPKEVKKPAPKPKPEKPKEKPEEAAQEDAFSSLLKNLAPDAAEQTPDQDIEEKDEESAPKGQIAPLGTQLSMSELDALKYQISKCWNVPSGAKYAENLSVEIRLSINLDGTVTRATIIDNGRYDRDPAYKAAADSALRAVRNPACSPLKLPADKYDRWKNTVLNFDPRDML